MIKPRHLLPAAVASLLLAICASAQTSLTQIRDTVDNIDGSPFNGTILITWNGFTSPGTASPLSTSAKIYNGALSVLVVPTTSGTAGTYYQVVYTSSDGTVSWTEDWQVPASTTPVTLAQVRISSTQSDGGSPPPGVQYATLPITINQVTNLGSDLSSINQTVTALTTQLNTLTSTVSGLSTSIFVDAETPAGTLNSSNALFTLANVPSPASSLTVYKNGLLQISGIDYTASGSSVTFLSGSIPHPSDVVLAYYRLGGSTGTAAFVDSETPSGTINGTNLVFTLAATPNPSSSLRVFKNGLLQQPSGDYTLSGSTITFASTATTPQTGDSIVASYRH